MILVAGDVGGTKTLLVAEERTGRDSRTLAEERLLCGDFPTFTALLGSFLKKLGHPVDCVALGIAGAVVGREVHGTNLKWPILAGEMEAELGIPRVHLLNDFAAAAMGVLALGPGDLAPIQPGEPSPDGAVGVIGAGTGLGEAMLIPADGHYTVVPTEGGHADFAARTDEEVELLRALRGKFGRVSYERILSGPGLANLYEFVKQREHHAESAGVAAALSKDETSAVVTSFDGRDPLCTEALDLFLSIYGAEAGNLALRAVATRGIYIAGGIAPRIVARFQDGRFRGTFVDKGRHRALVERIPINLVTNTRVGLLGALRVAEEFAGSRSPKG